MHFFALEPNVEVTATKTYSLIKRREELMVFLNERNLDKWRLKPKGFKILDNE